MTDGACRLLAVFLKGWDCFKCGHPGLSCALKRPAFEPKKSRKGPLLPTQKPFLLVIHPTLPCRIGRLSVCLPKTWLSLSADTGPASLLWDLEGLAMSVPFVRISSSDQEMVTVRDYGTTKEHCAVR